MNIVEHNKSIIKHSKLYFIDVAVVTLLFSLIYYKYQVNINKYRYLIYIK
jgi:hypothetical protein